MISLVIPTHNDSRDVAPTIRSALGARSTTQRIEFVVVDDGSTPDQYEAMVRELDMIAEPTIELRVLRSSERGGVPASRNRGGFAASGDVLFMTDAHIGFPLGWDQMVLQRSEDRRILSATIVDGQSGAKGYGRSLLLPFMWTRWNRTPPADLAPIQIPSAAGTVLPCSLFRELGGYDTGMRFYGAAEPEFAVRAWLSGAEVRSVPGLELVHRFKTVPERDAFMRSHRRFLVHNRLRFALLYLARIFRET